MLPRHHHTSPPGTDIFEQIEDYELLRQRARTCRQRAINRAVSTLWHRVWHPGAPTEQDARFLDG